MSIYKGTDLVAGAVVMANAANQDLSNLTATGEAHFVNTSLTNLSNGLSNTICTTKATTTSSASSAVPAVVKENYVNGTSWYRVWSDGWIEQGGDTGLGSNANEETFYFSKPFSNTNYTIVLSGYGSSSGVLSPYYMSVTKYTDSFKTYTWTDMGKRWYACGY